MLFFKLLGKAILVFFILFALTAGIMGLLGYSEHDMSQGGASIAVFIAILVFITSVVQNFKSIIIDAKDTTDELTSLVSSDEEDLYAIAEEEVNQKNIQQGLWSQALVKAKGDESFRKVEYMKLRVKQLKRNS